jgi:hypothetical protein
MLNDAIAKEIAVSIQYMWQHVQVIGVKAVAVQDQFKQTAITEMKHAESIAERLWYLEGVPMTQLFPIKVGERRKKPYRFIKRLSNRLKKRAMSRQLSCLKKFLRMKKNVTTSLPRCSKRYKTYPFSRRFPPGI